MSAVSLLVLFLLLFSGLEQLSPHVHVYQADLEICPIGNCMGHGLPSFPLGQPGFEQLPVCDAQGSSPLELSRWPGDVSLVFQAIELKPESPPPPPAEKRSQL